MNPLRYLLVISSLFCTVSLLAQRPEGPPNDGNQERHGGGPGAGMADRVLERLAQADPETATRLRELREQEPAAFRRELRSAMMKHGPELFRGDREGGKGGARGGRGDAFAGRGVLDRLRREAPTQFEELVQLRQEDPEAFQQRLGEIAHEYGERHKRGRDEVRQIMEVAKRYQASEDDAEKTELRSKLEGLVAKSFDNQLEEKEAWIKKLEADLEKQRERLVARRADRDALIQERLETILAGAPAEKRRATDPGPKPRAKPIKERR
jgi:hypothetical protein